MKSLLEISDHLERLAVHVGDMEVTREARRLSHRIIEAEDSDDIFWMSLGGCISQLALNPKARAISTELNQLAISCIHEARRLEKEAA